MQYVEREREHKVMVWSESHTVTVYRKLKSVWVAVGDYMGKRIEVQDRSEGAALKRWKEAARYRGN
jgi:hypothetical protein